MTANAWQPAVPFSSDAPMAATPTVANKCMYDYPVRLESPEAIDCTYGVGMLSEWDQATQRHKIVVPDADSVDASRCVVLPGCKVTPTESEPALIMGSIYPTRPIIARYDTDDGEPEIGDTLGTKADSWKLKKSGSGFTCLGIVDATEGLCLVRPFASVSNGASVAVPTVTDTFSTTTSITRTTIGSYSEISNGPITGRYMIASADANSPESFVFGSQISVGSADTTCINLYYGVEFLDDSMRVIARSLSFVPAARLTSAVRGLGIYANPPIVTINGSAKYARGKIVGSYVSTSATVTHYMQWCNSYLRKV
jgi:hypothetical protein